MGYSNAKIFIIYFFQYEFQNILRFTISTNLLCLKDFNEYKSDMIISKSQNSDIFLQVYIKVYNFTETGSPETYSTYIHQIYKYKQSS